MELNQYVGNKIKQFRLEKKLTQTQLADLLDTTKQTISRYEKGDRKANQDVLFALSDLFEKTIDDFFPPISKETAVQLQQQSSTTEINNKVALLDEELKEPRHSDWISYGENLLSEQNTVEDSKNTVVELFSYNYYDHAASAGTGQYLNDVQVETIELPVDYDADFVIPVYGDSMEPEYHSGDYVFVKLSVELSDGDIGVFEYYGDAYIKQLLIHAEGAFLHSLNDKYNDILIDRDSDFRIIGKVIGSYSEK
ncbi:LexA family transcriptional regulator [Streptococcus agalactiae]|uniref:LexA family transcriptional regulator n=1 Tax=Streptococcus agalactiae TaxID=1311 RepID=UPI000B49EAB7|nr:helix-turn-helix transcriptional regulator [Streptococcus agalactiae]ASA89464.1 XRE family transcriptional regulator [Streptococcus agalactiae]NHZ68984.1 helix-turn-helix domain-containing protein [Streptococcus agalactiae]HEN4418811.1 helix-turn-helix transcriptional regulator [Streptococcus agalactiae]HEN4473253.1 helix-turn-helix transcriptional regulator [Streptococcus agalactiae]HEN4551226.1 helix-turn-helix transcriptional regulator [Streptococcus agalactiae]